MGNERKALLVVVLVVLAVLAVAVPRAASHLRRLLVDGALSGLALVWVLADVKFEGPVLFVLPAVGGGCPTHGIVLADLPAIALLAAVGLHASHFARCRHRLRTTAKVL